MGTRETPGTLRKNNKTVRFRDSLVDAEELSSHQVLQLHDRVMEEQDESLERLGHSIRSQRELSIQIGDELENHVQLLDEFEDSVDRHQGRMGDAKRRLNKFAESAKEHGEFTARVGGGWLLIVRREFSGDCGADHCSGAFDRDTKIEHGYQSSSSPSSNGFGLFFRGTYIVREFRGSLLSFLSVCLIKRFHTTFTISWNICLLVTECIFNSQPSKKKENHLNKAPGALLRLLLKLLLGGLLHLCDFLHRAPRLVSLCFDLFPAIRTTALISSSSSGG